jgi:hypothetical protein
MNNNEKRLYSNLFCIKYEINVIEDIKYSSESLLVDRQNGVGSAMSMTLINKPLCFLSNIISSREKQGKPDLIIRFRAIRHLSTPIIE